ncbi:MAG: aldehyde dehydrogenase family protein [Elusimicrobiota bacterium]
MIDAVVARLAASARKTRRLPAHARAKALEAVSEGIRTEREAFARLICEEVGKPLKEARREVDRAAFTFRWAAGEALRAVGEIVPLDLDAGGEGRLAMIRRVPRGPCLFITPFNFPLNLAAHKVAPAMAVGAPFLLKPAPQAPKTAEKFSAVLKASGWPEDAFAVLPCSNEAAERLARDDRFAVLSFTGSAGVGWKLKALSPRKHVVLELGGNAGAVVASDAELPWAAARCAWGAFYYMGQVCISVQRIFVEEPVYDRFKDYFLKNVAELKAGDPKDDSVDIGPLIDAKAADRVEAWIKEAVSKGGRLLAGGTREGNLIHPTVVEDPPQGCALCCEEVFGPVATLEKVPSVDEAFRRIGSGRYGLQAGVFTRDMDSILAAWDELEVGGIIVNDIPSYRSEAMPYGGVKESGVGREGIRAAMEEFTEPRTLVLRRSM